MDRVKDKGKGREEVEAGPSGPKPTSVPGPRRPHPPPYRGPAPNGMATPGLVDTWIDFVKLDKTSKMPPKDGAYLMYSGLNLKDPETRKPFKAKMKEAGKGDVYDWEDTYRDTDALQVFGRNNWIDYVKNNPTHAHIPSFAMSWGQARHASTDKERPKLYMLYETKNDPIMTDNTYWGAVEAGIITGPNSKVQEIRRFNADELDKDPNMEGELMWSRDLHEPFGKTDSDWTINPKPLEPNPLNAAVFKP